MGAAVARPRPPAHPSPGPSPFFTAGWVNNRCPECAHGDIDVNVAGDGRWKARWYAVPCNVGDTKLNYKVRKGPEGFDG